MLSGDRGDIKQKSSAAIFLLSLERQFLIARKCKYVITSCQKWYKYPQDFLCYAIA